jgi:preprotein translocase subunit SecD
VLLLVTSVSGTLNAQAPAPVIPACQTMEVSIVAGKGAQSSRHGSAPDGTRIPLTGTPLLTIGDFTDANVSVTQSQVVLNVSMSTEAAERVHTFTATHVGTRLAFLVNGRVINTPKILDPITGKGFLIGPFSQSEAQTLSDSINHRDRGCEPQRKDSA